MCGKCSKHLDMTRQIRLWLSLADNWVPIISISKNEFILYSNRPLKWLRYLGFVIYGREGILKATRDGQEIEDYTIMSVNSLLSDYFYESNGKC
jgi:hypothetical protein